MSVAVGLGLMEFPFDGAASYWRWVDLCEAGGVDSLWQTDRLLSREPMLECMTAMAALAGRTRRIKFGMNVVSLALRDGRDVFAYLFTEQEQRSICTYTVEGKVTEIPQIAAGPGITPEDAGL